MIPRVGAYVIAAAATVLAASVAAVGAYVAAARRLSGRIETTEAASLWEESASIREDYRAQLHDAGLKIRHLEERLEIAETAARNHAAAADRFKREIVDLRAQVETCVRENEALRNTIRRVMNDA